MYALKAILVLVVSGKPILGNTNMVQISMDEFRHLGFDLVFQHFLSICKCVVWFMVNMTSSWWLTNIHWWTKFTIWCHIYAYTMYIIILFPVIGGRTRTLNFRIMWQAVYKIRRSPVAYDSENMLRTPKHFLLHRPIVSHQV